MKTGIQPCEERFSRIVSANLRSNGYKGGMNKSDLVQDIKAGLDRPVVLVGLMGAGKTRLGRMLASALGVEFFDTDHLIETEGGLTISQIFEQAGEKAFRDQETQVISRLLAPDHASACVVSTGGGAVMRPENKALIFGDTISVWLKTDIPVLAERLVHARNRPLLKNGNLQETLEAMAKLRYPLYEQADIIQETGRNTPQQILESLLTSISEKAKR